MGKSKHPPRKPFLSYIAEEQDLVVWLNRWYVDNVTCPDLGECKVCEYDLTCTTFEKLIRDVRKRLKK